MGVMFVLQSRNPKRLTENIEGTSSHSSIGAQNICGVPYLLLWIFTLFVDNMFSSFHLLLYIAKKFSDITLYTYSLYYSYFRLSFHGDIHLGRTSKKKYTSRRHFPQYVIECPRTKVSFTKGLKICNKKTL